MNFFAFQSSYNYVMATAVLHYSCVIESCSHKFLSIKRMLMHLRIYHPLASNARLRCAIEQCQHVFIIVLYFVFYLVVMNCRSDIAFSVFCILSEIVL